MPILDAPFDPTVNRCDPDISHMLNALCRRYDIPESWCEAAKTQAVIQKLWYLWCMEDGLSPYKEMPNLSIRANKRTDEALRDAYDFWSGR